MRFGFFKLLFKAKAWLHQQHDHDNDYGFCGWKKILWWKVNKLKDKCEDDDDNGGGLEPDADPCGCEGGDSSQATFEPGASYRGTAGSDLIQGTDADDTIAANDGADTVFGNEGSDFILGNPMDDFICGGCGDDTLLGGEGNDTVVGGAANDVLNGDEGSDTLTGGEGSDTFRFFGRTQREGDVDTVTDFDAAFDDVVLRDVGVGDYSIVDNAGNAELFFGDDLVAVFDNAAASDVAATVSFF